GEDSKGTIAFVVTVINKSQQEYFFSAKNIKAYYMPNDSSAVADTMLLNGKPSGDSIESLEVQAAKERNAEIESEQTENNFFGLLMTGLAGTGEVLGSVSGAAYTGTPSSQFAQMGISDN